MIANADNLFCLFSIGILTQELVRAQVLPDAAAGRPRPVQPASDFYTRKFGKRGWVLESGKKQRGGKQIKDITDQVLRALPEGSEVGMREVLEACRRSRREWEDSRQTQTQTQAQAHDDVQQEAEHEQQEEGQQLDEAEEEAGTEQYRSAEAGQRPQPSEARRQLSA